MAQLVVAGSVAVVTGAGGGIGAAIAHSLATRGATVVVSDIEADASDSVAADLQQRGLSVVARQADVTEVAAMDGLAEWVASTYGKIDILCNNAGATMRPFRTFWDASLADFRWMMEENYFGVVNGLRSFLPLMLNGVGHRHIVNTSSMAALVDPVGHAMYAASKAAVDSISDVLRKELDEQGHDIGVTVLYPGRVNTRIGTSERLRDPADRSEVRGVREYPRRKLAGAFMDAIEPDVVGEMLVRAVIENAPYCLSHPAPRDIVADWASRICDGYREPVGPDPASVSSQNVDSNTPEGGRS